MMISLSTTIVDLLVRCFAVAANDSATEYERRRERSRVTGRRSRTGGGTRVRAAEWRRTLPAQVNRGASGRPPPLRREVSRCAK